jgi:hypothetical protein
MKHLKILTLFIIAITTLAASCKKTTDPGSNDFYFRCKINGQTYIPNSCANCMGVKLLGDTTLLLNGNAGYETILIGVINATGIPITNQVYILNDNPRQGATYKNSTTTDNKFDTDATRTGQLLITALDKTNRSIEGTFYFEAYNPIQNKTVKVTEGEFRIKYTTN